jgi:hypothetical protein
VCPGHPPDQRRVDPPEVRFPAAGARGGAANDAEVKR